MEVWEEVLADRIAERENKREQNTRLIDIKELMKNMKLTADQAMNALGIPLAEQSKYSSLL